MGWLCSYTPLELIYAAGYNPFRIIGHSMPVESADSYIHPNYCQFVKSTIDLAIEGVYDFLDGVVFVNSCDAMRRLHDVWKRFIPHKFIFLLDIPMGDSTLGSKYLKMEFEKLKIALEDYSSNVITDALIEEAINLFTETRALYHELNSLRMENPPRMSGREITELTIELFHTDPKSWNEKVKAILKEKRKTTTNNDNPRIILSGSPIHDAEFIGFIEDCGLNVVYEDVCTGSKFFDIQIKKSADLLGSLSEAYLNRTPCARMMKVDKRVKSLIEVSKKFKTDGIIHHSLKFCDTYLFDVPILKEQLMAQGLSVLFIESDGGLGSLNQLKTRIEAFAEMIG